MPDIMPPSKVFLNPRVSLGEARAWETLYGFERFSFPEYGFLAHYEGRPPNKGMAYSEATEYNNIMKRVTIGLVMCFRPTWHPIRNFLFQFKRFADYLYHFHYLHTRYYNDCSRELHQFVFSLVGRMRFGFELSYGFARIPATLLEYENGYRYRVEDLFSASSKEQLLANPRKELRRIRKIYQERELLKGEGIEQSFIMVFRLLNLLLLIPKFKKAFKFALVDSEFKNFQLDEIETYWANRFTEYNFGGMPYQIRQLKQGFNFYV